MCHIVAQPSLLQLALCQTLADQMLESWQSGMLDHVQTSDQLQAASDIMSQCACVQGVASVVKQALKPAWKEGRVDVAIFKLISKKAVDKVMAAAPVELRTAEVLEDGGASYMTEGRQAKITKMVVAYAIKHGMSGISL